MYLKPLRNGLLSPTHLKQESTYSIFVQVAGQLQMYDNNAVPSSNVCGR
jgi:hypothetical protein